MLLSHSKDDAGFEQHVTVAEAPRDSAADAVADAHVMAAEDDDNRTEAPSSGMLVEYDVANVLREMPNNNSPNLHVRAICNVARPPEHVANCQPRVRTIDQRAGCRAGQGNRV